ncbi:MAG: class I SAM-dependent DNA methyltransferase [Verrucomicrobia bacterium]|nr:class I SAM-dependent DNA methyltransferase [Verrucomicrobiota bacterium]
MPSPAPASDPLAAFIARWSAAGSAERANYVLFLTELCDVLEVPRPVPASDDTAHNAYVFERAVPLHQRDGKTTTGRIDLYKRGCFVLEAKQYAAETPAAEPAQLAPALDAPPAKKSTIARGSAAWDDALLKARGQAERYARNLPAGEPTPPFLLVVDVGHVFELFADFSQQGKAYLPFPDARANRIRLADLRDEKIRARLRAVWLEPLTLDPAKISAAVTRDVARYLAELARHFEHQHDPATVAAFLSRCLFCMFAEDVDLLPRDAFTQLLESVRGDPAAAVPLLKALFEEMNRGGYSLALRRTLLHFNGGLFAESAVLPLDSPTLGLLIAAAKLDWKHVEPAIFGTLLERALHPAERHKLGAHYTPRAYVERLVLPTVVEPLREDWEHVRAAAVTLASRGDLKGAIQETRAFHHRLCAVRVLDPACGSGNFLYVALEHLKRLEGEVLQLAEAFGENMRLDIGGETVDPHQFLGIELNPRAATIAELVLWIGYLQWHHRNRGATEWPQPVLRAFHNIECRDAVLACDRKEFARDAAGKVRFVWDRKTMKTDPATGREVPDDKAVVPLETFVNPRPAGWPQAEFIVGNPPFLGKGKIREDLRDGYVETLREVYEDVPDSADFVMYWWHKAAEETLAGRTRRFGLITTNSIKQTFNRRVVKRALMEGVSLRFAIPDHPWVDTVDGAAVRIAMTVGALGHPNAEKWMLSEPPPPDPSAFAGDLLVVTHETSKDDGSADVLFAILHGRIGSGLNIGAELEDAVALKANDALASTGLILGSRGFVLSRSEADAIKRRDKNASAIIFPLRNGEDLTDKPRDAFVIDTHELSEDALRHNYPVVFDHLRSTVFEDRKTNRDPKLRKLWWLFRRSNEQVRGAIAGLQRYIVTVETTKHRVFQFLSANTKPEHVLIVAGLEDAFHLGVLSSRIHVVYALAAGGTLEDRPRYNKTRCFDPFPFPDCTEKQKAKIRALAEELDAHRKRAQAQHGIGLTDLYNVLEKIRKVERVDPNALALDGGGKNALRSTRSTSESAVLTPKEKHLHDQALVATLRQLHDDLDAAVADAYDWPWPLGDDDILARVVALNAARAAEEAKGIVRWLRPDYQQPLFAGEKQSDLGLAPADGAGGALRSDQPGGRKPGHKAPPTTTAKKAAWPKTLAERVRAVETMLAAEEKPATAAGLAKKFSRADGTVIAEILQTLVTLGRARPGDAGGTFVR